MSDEITLPCGVKLSRIHVGIDRWALPVAGGPPLVLEESAESLDARVLALRASLFPADAQKRVEHVIEQVLDEGIDAQIIAAAVLAVLGLNEDHLTEGDLRGDGLTEDEKRRIRASKFEEHYLDMRKCPNPVSRGGENVCVCPR